jgi:hypothetical protein
LPSRDSTPLSGFVIRGEKHFYFLDLKEECSSLWRTKSKLAGLVLSAAPVLMALNLQHILRVCDVMPARCLIRLCVVLLSKEAVSCHKYLVRCGFLRQ